ncbi:hypothetical protein [Pontibacter mangrovi]|nr:hypothetical protein [Pontibacter mangrovi]
MRNLKPHLRKALYFALGFMLMAFFIEGWPEIKHGLLDGYFIR